MIKNFFRLSALVCCISLTAATSIVRAQNILPEVDLDFQIPQLSDRVVRFSSSTLISSNTKVLVAGNFEFIDGEPVGNVAILNLDGTVDTSFSANVEVNIGALYGVRHAIPLADGRIVIAGEFNKVDGVDRDGIAILQSNGSLDTSFVPPTVSQTFFNPEVNAVAVQSDGKIIIGGRFDTLGTTSINSLARLNTNGTLDNTFTNPSVSGIVESIDIESGGSILIGGNFNSVGGETRSNLARVNSNGTVDTDYDIAVNFTVFIVKLDGDGNAIIGGQFTTVGGSTRNRIARIDTDGVLDATFNPNADNIVFSLEINSNGKILVGGQFLTMGGENRSGLVRLNSDGSVDTTLLSGFGTVYTISEFPNGNIIPGGDLIPDFFAFSKIQLIDSTGTRVTSFEISQVDAAGGQVTNMVPVGSDLLIMGPFTRVNGESRPSFAKLDSNGAVDMDFDPQVLYQSVTDAVVEDNGQIMVVGGFTNIDGVSPKQFARLNADGSVDVSFVPSPEVEIIPRTIIKLNSGNYLLAGNDVHLYSPAGVEDTSFLVSANGVVDRLLELPNGQILIAGNFDMVNGESRMRLAKLNADGTIDTSFDAQLSQAPGSVNVRSLVLQPDGQILLGGIFNSVDGEVHINLARISLDGTVDSSFNPSTNRAGVNRILLQPDGKIIVGGAFTELNGVERVSLGRLLPDGTLDTDFDLPANGEPGASNGIIQDMVFTNDKKMMISGTVYSLGDTPIETIARIQGIDDAFCITIPAGAGFAAFCL